MGPRLKIGTKNSEDTRNRTAKHDDYHFFRSVLPHMSALPPSRRSQVRAKIKESILFEIRSIRQLTHAEMLTLRASKGEFRTLYKSLRQNERAFVEYLRMSVKTFDTLLCEIGNKLKDDDESRYIASISSEERLVIALKHLNSGDTAKTLSSRFLIGVKTVSNIILHACRIIWSVLKDKYVPLPTTEEWLGISEKFFDEYGFPNCVGAINKKNIHMKAPNHNRDVKRFILLHLVVDAEGKIIFVDTDTEAYKSKSTRFENSFLYYMLQSNNLNLPTEKRLPNSDIQIPFVFVGSRRYPLLNCLMNPFPGQTLSDGRKIYNRRLYSALKSVDLALHTMESKWKILEKLSKTNMLLDRAVAIVRAVSVLHNVVMTHEHFRMPPDEADSSLRNKRRRGVRTTQTANNNFVNTATQTRTILVDYFNRTEDGDRIEISTETESHDST